ncbi:MAG: hypothetical protein MSA33_06395 [Campylobacter sp.]|uniref:hypothetical protein n=1 Tax=Campylobacter sp. TaxID=205 RepID=UPI002AA80AA2|nr:hypothetical protein [Campylobacter sp.]MCI7550054.1 hypothetical protein [Campylobacter sp.]
MSFGFWLFSLVFEFWVLAVGLAFDLAFGFCYSSESFCLFFAYFFVKFFVKFFVVFFTSSLKFNEIKQFLSHRGV